MAREDVLDPDQGLVGVVCAGGVIIACLTVVQVHSDVDVSGKVRIEHHGIEALATVDGVAA